MLSTLRLPRTLVPTVTKLSIKLQEYYNYLMLNLDFRDIIFTSLVVIIMLNNSNLNFYLNKRIQRYYVYIKNLANDVHSLQFSLKAYCTRYLCIKFEVYKFIKPSSPDRKTDRWVSSPRKFIRLFFI